MSMMPTLDRRPVALGGVFEIRERTRSDRFRSTGSETAPEGNVQKSTAHGVELFLEGYVEDVQALRSELPAAMLGARDSDLALASFEQSGIDALDQLNGPFALATYSAPAEELILARDRVGQLPLYYWENGTQVRFSTDLVRLVAELPSAPPINMQAVEAYLQLTYIPAPMTIYQGVRQLLPGTYLRVTSDGINAPQRYWDLDYSETNQVHDLEQCKLILREGLTAAVAAALRTPKQVGTLLSGGIDSTIITGLAAQELGRPVDAFTIGFGDRKYDETDRAQLSAAFHNVSHHVLQLEYDDVLSNLEAMLLNLDQPYGDSSYLAAYMVSTAARDHVDVVLTGDAGDELFAGYNKHLIGHYAGLYNKVPRWIRRPAIWGANRVLPAQSHLRRKINKVADSAQLQPFEQRMRLMSLGFYGSQLDSIMLTTPSRAIDELIRGHYDKYSENSDELRRALYTDFKVVLEGDMMPKSYYAGRAAGLQTRIPLLNRGVMEGAARIPSSYKISARNTKIILKETFSDLIPPKLLTAPKSGFSLPMGSWMRHEMRLPLERTLSEDRIRDYGILNYLEVQRLMDEHFSGTVDHSSRLWVLYILMDWLDRGLRDD